MSEAMRLLLENEAARAACLKDANRHWLQIMATSNPSGEEQLLAVNFDALRSHVDALEQCKRNLVSLRQAHSHLQAAVAAQR